MFLGIGLIVTILAGFSSANKAITESPNNKAIKRPLIVGHRGASGMYPEHTALAYRYSKFNIINKDIASAVNSQCFIPHMDKNNSYIYYYKISSFSVKQ